MEGVTALARVVASSHGPDSSLDLAASAAGQRGQEHRAGDR